MGWGGGGRWEETVETGQGLRTQYSFPPFPGFQDSHLLGDPPTEPSVGIWAAAEGTVPSALAGAGSAVLGCSEEAPVYPSEAVGIPPHGG